MSILVDAGTRVLVQGITGRIGRVQTGYMRQAGTVVAAGVTPGRGGADVAGVPVYDTVREAVDRHRVNTSVLFVPVPAALDSVMEALSAGIGLLVLVTEHIPVHDVMKMRARAAERGAVLIGPTTPGVIAPGCCKVGILPATTFCPGRVGAISRSGTLSYEVAADLCASGYGQSTVVGMGADMVAGTDLSALLEMFERDPDTGLVVIVGEVGGSQEEDAAELIAGGMSTPVVAYIAGASAPEGQRMGHAGAIIEGGRGSARSKVAALAEAGAHVAERLHHIPPLVRELLDG